MSFKAKFVVLEGTTPSYEAFIVFKAFVLVNMKIFIYFVKL